MECYEKPILIKEVSPYYISITTNDENLMVMLSDWIHKIDKSSRPYKFINEPINLFNVRDVHPTFINWEYNYCRLSFIRTNVIKNKDIILLIVKLMSLK